MIITLDGDTPRHKMECAVGNCRNRKEKEDDLTCRPHDLLIPRKLRRKLNAAEQCNKPKRRMNLIIRTAREILRYLEHHSVEQTQPRLVLANGSEINLANADPAAQPMRGSGLIIPGGK